MSVLSDTGTKALTATVQGHNIHVPTPALGIWHKKTLKIYFGPEMAAGDAGAYGSRDMYQRSMKAALQSPYYEVSQPFRGKAVTHWEVTALLRHMQVRAGALKGALKVHLSAQVSDKHADLHGWLAAELTNVLRHETHHKVCFGAEPCILGASYPP